MDAKEDSKDKPIEINKETVLEQLLDFEKRPPELDNIPDDLEKYIEYIAQTGDTLYPWNRVKPLIKKKLELVIDEFHKENPNIPGNTLNCPTFNYDELKKEIVESVENFYGAPFTIQRICELLTLPSRHYKRTDKFMRGLEKNILVVSCVEPSRSESPQHDRHPLPYHPFGVSAESLHGYAGNGSLDSDKMFGSGILQGEAHHSKEAGTSSAPTPLQQLDSFTTVFSSPPSTPLAVVSDMHPYSSSSSSSSESMDPEPHCSSDSGHSSQSTSLSPTSDIVEPEAHCSTDQAHMSTSPDLSEPMEQSLEEPVAKPAAPLEEPVILQNAVTLTEKEEVESVQPEVPETTTTHEQAPAVSSQPEAVPVELTETIEESKFISEEPFQVQEKSVVTEEPSEVASLDVNLELVKTADGISDEMHVVAAIGAEASSDLSTPIDQPIVESVQESSLI
ncbi:Serine/threonine-protein phosphatase 4 regulatory subunit 2 [Halotydeus destructor]|nr:Serine/threonine-protein phosphatase 4 regulatory subunit 2 [Halotydeus destructor]